MTTLVRMSALVCRRAGKLQRSVGRDYNELTVFLNCRVLLHIIEPVRLK